MEATARNSSIVGNIVLTFNCARKENYSVPPFRLVKTLSKSTVKVIVQTLDTKFNFSNVTQCSLYILTAASSTSSNNLDLTRSAFIPPPMEPLPTTPSSPGPPKLNCPTLNGLFPYGGDCSKFINCWRGRPHVQACAPGTLFSSITLNCDHAANVICQSIHLSPCGLYTWASFIE